MATKPTALSISEARAAALRAQRLLAPTQPAGPHAMLRELAAVQLDTISVLARSHELVAYARLGATPRAGIEDAYWGEPSRAFEYWAHAACIMPVELWPYFAFRRRALRVRVPRFGVPKKTVDEVRARLRNEPVTSSDLGGARNGTAGWWNWSDAKRAIEGMYARGDVICTTRRSWKRVYDLPERALSPDLIAHEPTDAECYAHLVAAAGRALGVGTKRDIAEYFRLTMRPLGVPADCRKLLDTAIAESELIPVTVEGWDEPAYADRAALQPARNERCRTTLLSPFDSLVWDRARTLRLFGMEFSLEAYKPKADRIHGYYSMPLLAEGTIIGRIDPAREGSTLIARNVVLDDASHAEAAATALREAAAWVGCDAVRVDAVTPRTTVEALRRALKTNAPG